MRVFNHLTDDELLRQLGVARFHSPVIEELCKRMETNQASVVRGELECPVCMALLDASFDPDKQELNLEMKE